jgi:ribosomal protein S18 acetylase RimI-like enzyme
MITLRPHDNYDSVFITEQSHQFDRFGQYAAIFQQLLDGKKVAGVTKHVEFLIAELNGIRAGFAAVEWTETSGKIHGIAVDPGSKRKGVGRELLAAIRRHAIEKSSKHLECITAENDNPEALELFVKSGFENMGFAGQYPQLQRAVSLRFTLPER